MRRPAVGMGRDVNLFGIGSQEMFMIAVLAVILFGEKLPDVARTVARFSRQVRDVSRDFQNAIRLDD